MSKNGRRKPQTRSADLIDAPHLPPVGRPTRLTADVNASICRSLAMGLTMQCAASLAGVSVDALYGWMRRGKASKGGKYAGFVKAVEQSLCKFEERNANIINMMAQGGDGIPPDWKAALTLLERRRPATWSKTERHEVTGQGGGPVRYEIVREEGGDWRQAIEIEATVNSPAKPATPPLASDAPTDTPGNGNGTTGPETPQNGNGSQSPV